MCLGLGTATPERVRPWWACDLALTSLLKTAIFDVLCWLQADGVKIALHAKQTAASDGPAFHVTVEFPASTRVLAIAGRARGTPSVFDPGGFAMTCGSTQGSHTAWNGVHTGALHGSKWRARGRAARRAGDFDKFDADAKGGSINYFDFTQAKWGEPDFDASRWPVPVTLLAITAIAAPGRLPPAHDSALLKRTRGAAWRVLH